MPLSQLLQIKGIKCSACKAVSPKHALNAQYLKVTAVPRLLNKDKVFYQFLCKEHAGIKPKPCRRSKHAKQSD